MTALAELHAEHAARRARFAAAAMPCAAPALPEPVQPRPQCATAATTTRFQPPPAPRQCACMQQLDTAIIDLPAFIGRFQPTVFKPAPPDYHRIALRIINRCALDAGITPMALKSVRRQKAESRARQKAMWLIKHETPWTLPKIGAYLGRRDHTTILLGIAAFEAREPGFCAAWRAVNVGKGVAG